MKAIVLERPGSVSLREVPRPVPAPGEALIEIKASSICGSDLLRVYAGHAKTYPLILGHEFAGIITEIGPGVSADWMGQHVAVAPLIPCMKCDMCVQGLYSACMAYSFIGSRRPGGYAEYCAVPIASLVPLPGGMDFEVGAILEPATVALHALERGGFQAGQSVAVLGVGSVGQYVVQWARINGAGLIVATDTADDNLAMARAQGAAHTLNPLRDGVPARVAALTGNGVDLVLEIVGRPETLIQSVAVVRPRGTIVCVGNQPHDATLPTDLIEQVMRKELRMCGTWMSYSSPFPGHEWSDGVAAALRGELELRGMISHRITLDAVPGIMAQINAHAVAHRKIVILP
jgi:L-iditol 2-dehydrogenase